ncbi:MAG TPA: hypothetical protein VNC60_09475, partial [Actinomycetota bacterium]|nr:hypothetical protein [Actinomycetota bacterium]
MAWTGRYGSIGRREIAIAAGVLSAAAVVVAGWVLIARDDGPGVTGAPRPGPVSVRTPAPANRSFEGLTTFRGNAARSYYGEGPVPLDPEIRWRHPERTKLCSDSIVALDVSEWCGTGWTG